jgi:hypothetical protein
MTQPSTLRAQWNALVVSLPIAGRGCNDVLYSTQTADDALAYAMSWRPIAISHSGNRFMTKRARATWLRVVYAAEDLAAVALSELRKAR